MRLQPLAIAYLRRHGLPLTRSERPGIAWYGDMELAPHLAGFVREGPIDVHIAWAEPIAFEAGTDRKMATTAAEASVREAMQRALSGQYGEGPARARPSSQTDRRFPATPSAAV